MAWPIDECSNKDVGRHNSKTQPPCEQSQAKLDDASDANHKPDGEHAITLIAVHFSSKRTSLFRFLRPHRG